jgi:hypothetical protein
MAAFTRVELPPGPMRELLDVLTELHIKTGEQTAVQICDAIKNKNPRNGVCADTVWRVMCGNQLSKWKYIEAIVDVLGGQPEEVRPLFEASRTASVAPHKVPAVEAAKESLVL